ncbi:MAG: BadF/BadG/BcrA/BcrD ATPase family protein [Aliidongia sp.]
MGALFLGVDGGGSGCRVRLADGEGLVLGSAAGGPGNIRLGLDAVWAAILAATDQALAQAGFDRAALSRIHAGLGLAGIVSPADAARIRAAGPDFAGVGIATDSHAACLGAFAGADGGIVIVGTGSAGYALIGGVPHAVGGWGFEVSDQGSGADIGREAIRAALLGHDGLGPHTDFSRDLMARLGGHPAEIVAWAGTARPRDYAELVRQALEFAERGDPIATAILKRAAGQISRLIERLQEMGAAEICLMGGLGPTLETWLPPSIRGVLVKPRGDAVDGALHLAREAAAS